MCHPHTEITSCVISMMRRRMSGLEIFPTTAPPSSTTCSENSAPQCRSSIGSMILPSQWQISFKFMVTGSVTDTGLISLKSERTQCLRRGDLLPHSTSWIDAPIPENLVAPLPVILTSASAASSAPNPSRTPPPLAMSLSPLALSWMTPGMRDLSLRINTY